MKKDQRETMRRTLLMAQDGKCYYCSTEITESPTFDHIIPQCRGGTNDLWNLVLSCAECNVAKDNMPIEAFVFMRRLQAEQQTELEALVARYEESRPKAFACLAKLIA